jgi:hypothetical protein
MHIHGLQIERDATTHHARALASCRDDDDDDESMRARRTFKR